ncbi:mechanosensitive ion channel family protein [Pseudoduganella violaceinigra]|uniref:mechanosensitive ion channel family protein n=1 Tax=Pseudoduganella violaceinigra TaxID=246602 RepID=UPI00040362DC|nr:mechanosensitive ion channel domain-containing protein [Pseudoduganella violaceinigra]
MLKRTLFGLLLLAFCQFSHALQAATPPLPRDAPSAHLAVGNRTVMVFRAMLSGYTPQDRVDAAGKRLERALANGGPQQASVRSISEGTQVLLDGSLLFLITPGDINALAGDSTDLLAQESAAQLSKALQERSEQRSLRYVALAVAYCILATCALAMALWMLAALRRYAGQRLEAVLGQRLARVRVRNVSVLDAGHLVHFTRLAVNVSAWFLGLLAAYIWLAFVLARIPFARNWGERLQDFLFDTAAGIAGSVAQAIPGLLIVAVIAVLARLATATLASVFARVESGELQFGWLDHDTATPTRRLASVCIWLFALAMAYPYLPGSQTAAFQGVTVLAGLMLSIGASSIVGQGAAGLILMYTRALRKGDYVSIGDVQGTVVEPGVFDTRVRNGMGIVVAMPNAWVIGNTIKNYSRAVPGACVIDTMVTIGYDTPWRLVHALLEEAAGATEGIAAEPRPFVMQCALSDFYIEYKLVAISAQGSPHGRSALISLLHQNVVDVFNREGVQIMSPHFVQEPPRPQMVAPELRFPEHAASARHEPEAVGK